MASLRAQKSLWRYFPSCWELCLFLPLGVTGSSTIPACLLVECFGISYPHAQPDIHADKRLLGSFFEANYLFKSSVIFWDATEFLEIDDLVDIVFLTCLGRQFCVTILKPTEPRWLRGLIERKSSS
jgi:hypothetical protein